MIYYIFPPEFPWRRYMRCIVFVVALLYADHDYNTLVIYLSHSWRVSRLPLIFNNYFILLNVSCTHSNQVFRYVVKSKYTIILDIDILVFFLAPSCFVWNKDIQCVGLIHWGRGTHICVGNLTIIVSDNGLSPGRRQLIIVTNAGILLVGP